MDALGAGWCVTAVRGIFAENPLKDKIEVIGSRSVADYSVLSGLRDRQLVDGKYSVIKNSKQCAI